MTISVLCRLREHKNIIQLAGFFLVVCGGFIFSSPSYSQSVTLLEIKKRGSVECGVNVGLKGFAQPNSLGEYSGLDSDFCRAVASAIFDDPDAVNFVPLTESERFEALQSAVVDLMPRNAAWTLSRNTDYGEFVGVNYYDGQGFLVPKRSGVRSALELDNLAICVLRDTSRASNAADYFVVNRMRFRPVYYDDNAKNT